MKDIRIEVRDNNYIVVTATTSRFGKNAVMFEGNTFDQCFDYVKRETGQESLQLSSYLCLGSYTDREGRTFPSEMSVR
jgi:hypothetical protein